MTYPPRIWIGIDIGKEHHHAVVLDEDGTSLVSRRLANREDDILTLLTDAHQVGQVVTWAVDLANGLSALLLAILLGRGEPVVYLSGIAANRAAQGYTGAGKTDARDARIIADQARMRHDLRRLTIRDDTAIELELLTARRSDLVAERTRTINRMRSLLNSQFPSLDSVLDFRSQGALTLVAGYQSPAAIRALGPARLERWLRNRKVRNAATLAATVHAAAREQTVLVPGHQVAAQLIHDMATSAQRLTNDVARIDAQIQERIDTHRLAPIIASMPGFGTLMAAEFLAATDGDMGRYKSPDHLAAHAGLAPAPRDSGKRTGNLHRPRRYDRRLQRVFYTSDLLSIQTSTSSRTYYDRKRAAGHRHNQAVLALARRRVNVLWALLRDQRNYLEPTAAPLEAA